MYLRHRQRPYITTLLREFYFGRRRIVADFGYLAALLSLLLGLFPLLAPFPAVPPLELLLAAAPAAAAAAAAAVLGGCSELVAGRTGGASEPLV